MAVAAALTLENLMTYETCIACGAESFDEPLPFGAYCSTECADDDQAELATASRRADEWERLQLPPARAIPPTPGVCRECGQPIEKNGRRGRPRATHPGECSERWEREAARRRQAHKRAADTTHPELIGGAGRVNGAPVGGRLAPGVFGSLVPAHAIELPVPLGDPDSDFSSPETVRAIERREKAERDELAE